MGAGYFGIMKSRQGSRRSSHVRPSTSPVDKSRFLSAFNCTPLPPRPNTAYGFGEMDVLSPSDVLRRHLGVFKNTSTGDLPSIKPRRAKPTTLQPRCPYRVPSGKIGIDRSHRLTPSRSSPSMRQISSIIVLYTHDSQFLDAPAAVKKITADELEPLVERTGFTLKEMFGFSKWFQKLLSGPLARGVDQEGFANFMNKFGPFDSSDTKLNKRLFDVQNTRGGFNMEFDRVVEMLNLLKKSDTLTKAKMFYTLVDESASGRLSLSEIDGFFGGPLQLDDIVKEHRKLSVNKIMDAVYVVLGKGRDARISKEEFLSAVMQHADVIRFFDRVGYLVQTSAYM